MTRLNAYLTFNGNCQEAMHYYKDILGGELSIMLAGDSPVKDQMPPQYHSQVLHSTLKSNGFEVMASDMTPAKFEEGNTVHLCLLCQTEEEIRLLFEKLSAGGKISQPLNQMFFGLIGTLTDKFSKHWMLASDNQV
jgi:PhnB protein